MPGGDPAAAVVRGLYASLHVGAAAGSPTVGRVEEARHHLARAQAADGYGRLVRAEVEQVRARLDG